MTVATDYAPGAYAPVETMATAVSAGAPSAPTSDPAPAELEPSLATDLVNIPGERHFNAKREAGEK